LDRSVADIAKDRVSSFGCRIGPMPAAADGALLAALSDIPVACVSDVIQRLAAGGADIRPIGKAALCGAAVTVRVPPGDNLMVHKAIDLARPGDVIVVDSGGDLTNAKIGERMVIVAMEKRLAGFVIFGAVRDAAFLRTCPLPVFAAGITHRGPYKHGPGEINYPIGINGLVVAPGDVILGDDDGFVALPAADAPAIAAAARRKADYERDTPPTAGDKSYIDATLRKLNCEGL
jgi:regulator of RNase E activity RraA